MPRASTRAVFFDVDFTLIYPGPTFQGEGYQRFCAAHGIQVDPAKFLDAVIAASPILNDEQELLYDDVTPVLQALDARGFKVGLISNSHRCLASFQQHFELHGLIAAAISSSEHGFLKPHPSIFEAALRLVGVQPEEAVMVGDSLVHDIEGARRVGMRGVLVRRAQDGAGSDGHPADVPVIRTLADLPALI
jgi:HAD superfamily hydrolase (TIGR01662 family)